MAAFGIQFVEAPMETTTNRIKRLTRAASDASTAVQLAYAPFEVAERASLNVGARKAAEVGVVNLVTTAILAEAARASAVTSARLASDTPTSFRMHCFRCHQPGQLFVNRQGFRKFCFTCGGLS